MDPISVVASIIGLVGAAAKVSESLFKFIGSLKYAPKLASSVLQEVSDTSACLSQLQSLLMGKNVASRSHENLLMVEQIIVALSNCVLIFSELEEIAESLKPSEPMQPGRLAQWVLKEQTIKTLFVRLQSSKISLNLMITTMTCASVGEAQASVGELASLVTQVLDSNQHISRRMAWIEQQTLGRSESTVPTITGRDAVPSPSVVGTDSIEDNQSMVTIKGLISDPQNGTNSEPIYTFGFSFDRDLNTSRPYARAMKRHSVWSAVSSEIHTMGWSCLSGLSPAEVSQISVINLPILPQDLWNGQNYGASRIEEIRVGLVLSKSHSSSPGSLKTQLTLTPKRRQKISSPLSMNEEDAGVPVTDRNISLLGSSLSGKTTVFNHLQILYGDGVLKFERISAFETIVTNLIDIFIRAWCIWRDHNPQESYALFYEHFPILLDATSTTIINRAVAESCQRVFRHLWNNEGVRETILDFNQPMFDENVPYFMENLEQLLTPDQIVSDPVFLRLNRRGLGVWRQPIHVGHMQYQVLDPSEFSKWRYCMDNVGVVIFVVSLTDYYKASDRDEKANKMVDSLDHFAAVTKVERLKSTPFVVLLNKFDLFEEVISSKPVRDYFASYCGSPDPSLACNYFADEFLKLDKRLNTPLRIYRTSAVDRDSFKATMDSILQTMPLSTEDPEISSPITPSAPVLMQTDKGWIGDNAARMLNGQMRLSFALL